VCHLMKSSCYSGGSQWQYFVGTLLFSHIQDAVIFNGNVENVLATTTRKSNPCGGMVSEWGSMCTAGVHRFFKILVTTSKF